MLDLMYITNRPKIAQIAQRHGVNRIFVDMEYIGKDKRQGGMDTVQNHHTVADVKNIRRVLDKSELLVRVNPIHENSQREIQSVIEAGADIIMLPMWQTADDVSKFLSMVSSRAKTMLLLENVQAVKNLDRVLSLDGIDEVHIGLNDLHLSLNRTFLFELLADGTVERLANQLNQAGVKFGFGGFGRIGEGLLPAECIVSEHYRLGSTIAILSRSFCRVDQAAWDYEAVDRIFADGVNALRSYEKYLEDRNADYFKNMHSQLCCRVNEIVGEIKNV